MTTKTKPDGAIPRPPPGGMVKTKQLTLDTISSKIETVDIDTETHTRIARIMANLTETIPASVNPTEARDVSTTKESQLEWEK